MSNLKRSTSDPPPPITIEDTATGKPPEPSPSPTAGRFILQTLGLAKKEKAKTEIFRINSVKY
jgi:hypothetical protein